MVPDSPESFWQSRSGTTVPFVCPRRDSKLGAGGFRMKARVVGGAHPIGGTHVRSAGRPHAEEKRLGAFIPAEDARRPHDVNEVKFPL